MSNYYITGFDTTLNDTVNYVDLGQIFMDISHNQTINGFVSYRNNPISRYAFNDPSQLINKLYVDNIINNSNNILYQTVTFTSLITPINFTNTINYPSNVIITNNDITFKQNNFYNAINADQVYTFGAGSRITGGNNIWVAGGQGTYTLSYSYDGIYWFPVYYSNTIMGSWCNSVAWNGSIWVAMGQGTFGVAYSYDGLLWTGCMLNALFNTNTPYGCSGNFAWNGVLWVGFSSQNTGACNFIYSYDGINWFPNANGGLTGFVNPTNCAGQIAWNGILFVLGTCNQTSNLNFAYSYDGIRWFWGIISGTTTAYCNAIAWNGSIWTCPAGGAGAVTYYSRDGITWIAVSNTINFQNTNSPPSYCIWTGQYFLASSYGNSNTYNLAYAITGIGDWVVNTAANTIPLGVSMIAYNGKMFLAPSFNASNIYINYGGNGQWVYGAVALPSTTKVYFVAHGGRKENVLYLPQSRTLVLGSGNNSSIAYSLDGSANWIGGNVVTSWGGGSAGLYYTSAKSMLLFSNANGAAWNGSMWVAAGTPNNVPNYTTLLTIPSVLNYSNNINGASTSYFGVLNNVSTFAYPGQNGSTWTALAWTIEAWIKIPVSGSNTGTCGIIGAYNTNFGIGTYNNFLNVQNANAIDTLSLADNTWHYIAVTVKNNVAYGSNYYIDGVQRPNSFTSILNTANYTTNPFCIGSWATSGALNTNFIGEIAEIRIWNYALAPTQILAQWNANVPSNSNGLVAYYNTTSFFTTPTLGTISAGTVLVNAVTSGSNISNMSFYYNTNNITFDIVPSPSFNKLYNYTNYNIAPQNTLAYSHIIGNTTFGNAGNLWIGMGNSVFTISANNIAWNGNVWVAVGQSGGTGNTIAYSPDGFTWIGLNNRIFSNWGNSLAWNGTYWIATGFGANTLAYSGDGVTWTGLGNVAFSTSANGVSWNGSMWVAVGTGGNTMAYSMDGRIWTGLGTTTFYLQGNDVASNIQGTMWVAAGSGNIVSGVGNVLAWSMDGINWNKPTGNIYTAQNVFSFAGSSVVHNGKYWIATGSGANTIAYSQDGNTWIGQSNTAITFNANRAVYNQGLGSVRFKTNYFNFIGSSLTSGVSNQSLWVAAGSPYGLSSTGTIVGNTLGFSKNGLSWFGLGNSVFYISGQFVAYNGTIWVAGGQGANTLAYSYNGITWTGIGSNIFTTIGNFAKWNGVIWVAVGQGANTLAWSIDGINWTGLGSSIFSYYGSSIEWNGMMWVAGGSCAGNNLTNGNTLAYSTNGFTWTGIGGNIFSTSCNSILWNGFMWTATGGGANWKGSIGISTGNTFAYSINGFNWFGISAYNNMYFNGAPYYGQSLAYNGKIWVAVGSNGSGNSLVSITSSSNTGNTIVTSVNGNTWIPNLTSAYIFTNVCTSVKWDGKMFVAGGQAYTTGIGGGNSLAYSYSGNNWVGLGNAVFSGNVFGIACKNLFINKILLDNNVGVNKTQSLDIVSDSVYQTGHTGLSVFVNAQPYTSTLYPSIVNGNFNALLFNTNSQTVINSLYGWLVSDIGIGEIISIGNGTGGNYGYLYCPSPQFLILQTAIIGTFNISQTIFINSGNYTLSFHAAPRYNNGLPGYYYPNQQITASISFFNANNSIYSITTSFTSYTNPWSQFILPFTITTSEYYVLQFTSTNTIAITNNTDTSIGLTEITIF